METYVTLADRGDLRQFLESQAAATLAVLLDTNGAVHAASLLYWLDTNTFRFYFVTSKSTEKYKLLKSKTVIPAALVIGTEVGTDFTVQLRGTLRPVDPKTHAKIVDAYYQKRGNRHDDITDSDNCLLELTPTWGRFTDYNEGYDHFYLDLK